MFQPKILSPTADPFFVRELRKIDPNLRVEWGYERYLNSAWAIERRLSPEEYFTKYGSVVENDLNRYVWQPIFDVNQYEYDPETGEPIAYKQIGVRKFDLAPEWEWVGTFDVLDARALTEIKRAYAWNRNHLESRKRFEQEQREAEDRTNQQQKNKRIDETLEGIDEALHETRAKVQFGYGETRKER